jgi:hypothetical protein
MTKLKIINIGPIEWFSPHFAYNDSDFDVYNYDPLKMEQSLITFCKEISPDILYIFRGDLVREQLPKLRHIFQLEFSTEIYPTDILSVKKSQAISVAKFMHCLKSINPFSNIYHYDISRKQLFDALDVPMKYNILPINIKAYKKNIDKDIDILFFGRASDRRRSIFDKLKEAGLKFVWIENGLDWEELSSMISRSKVVLNITAENIDNFEPRILLALSGGACVITELSIGLDYFLKSNPQYKNKVRTVNPDSESILNGYFYFLLNEFYYADNIDNEMLSSNKFILEQFIK